jgi:broad specificity phosphatase PhoE
MSNVDSTLNTYTTIYIVRHGESIWNTKSIVQGQLNNLENTLTTNGELQSREIAIALKDIYFQAIYSSDLLRAHQTAEIIALEHELEVNTNEALREKSHGEYEGTENQAYLQLFTMWASLTDHERLHYKVTESGETPAEAMKRFTLFLKEIALAHSGNAILVVTHGGIMKDFLISQRLKSYDGFAGFKNTGFIKLRCDGEKFLIDDLQGLK